MAERGALFLWRGNPWIDEFREFCELSWVISPPRNWWIPWNPWILWIELGYLPTQEMINSVNFMNSVNTAGLPPHWWFPWIPWILWIELGNSHLLSCGSVGFIVLNICIQTKRKPETSDASKKNTTLSRMWKFNELDYTSISYQIHNLLKMQS